MNVAAEVLCVLKTMCYTVYLFPLPEVECDYLKGLEYGVVNHEGVYVGDNATYSCHYGYKLIGKSTRKCLYDGNWSDEEPKCIKSMLESL